jgi:hypothetical protein
MRHIQNDMLQMQIQNALMAQQMAEANKNRKSENARSEAAEELAELQKTEELKSKIVREVSADGKNQKDSTRDLRLQRYRKDGTLEDNSSPGGDAPPKRIDIKI